LSIIFSFFRSETCILVLIIVLAFILRTYLLQDIPTGLFLDEISAAYYPFLYQHGLVSLSFGSIISYLLTGTFFTYSLAGPFPFFIRLPAVFFGTLLVFVVYLLSKEMFFSKKVSILSALLIAISPWGFHFSRFQALDSSYVLFFTTALLFVYKGINNSDNKKKLVWYCLGSLMLGLTADIFSSAAVFVPLFIVILLLLYLPKKLQLLNIRTIITPKAIGKITIIVAIFLLTYSPVFIDYILQASSTAVIVSRYSTYSHSQNIFDWFRMIFERARMHLSPGFLIFTAPSTHDLGFQETMGQRGLLRYSPTTYGELNYVAILLYPGILLLFYEAVKNRRRSFAVLLGWIICYSIVSGIAYFDNPSPGRNIVGMPALVITIALFIDFLVKITTSSRLLQMKNNIISHLDNYIKPITVIFLAALVIIPTSLFLYEYYVVYPAQSAKVFDYGYKDIANFLSDNNLWGRDILINSGWGSDLKLSFYSAIQPPPSIVRKISSVYDLTNSLTQISKDITFNQGLIEYDTRMDDGYGNASASSSHIRLAFKTNNIISLAIYNNNSLYTPNSYLLLQEINGKHYFEQGPLNETVEYGKWYKVALKINSTAISIYFDRKLVNTVLRQSEDNDNKVILELAGESAAVSFKNVIINQHNNQAYDSLFNVDDDNTLFGWKTISGKLVVVKQDSDRHTNTAAVTLLPLVSHKTLLVTTHSSDSITLAKYGIASKLLKEVYYPDGNIAFLIFELAPYSNR
jgi:hypothetical protein